MGSGTPGGRDPDKRPDGHDAVGGTGRPRAVEDGHPAPRQGVTGRDEYAHSTESDLDKAKRPGEEDEGGPLG